METKIENQQKVLCETIVEKCTEMNVRPSDVLTVLGGGVIHFIMKISDITGHDGKKMVKIFADGLANAKIELKSKKKR